ncbi:hypothetical protein [Rivularia sp. UHCC 0363]|nr:hypothetical protein [Rivularia sp. UHCC 0363]MEA5596448.1 hypothetical protein [Rivularia sp. UHCC 0363]
MQVKSGFAVLRRSPKGRLLRISIGRLLTRHIIATVKLLKRINLL